MGRQNLLLAIIAVSCTSVVHSDDQETVLRVLPANIAVEPGENVTLECTHYPEDTAADANLEWYRPGESLPISTLVTNKTAIDLTNSSIQRFSSEHGTLTIANIQPSDAGTYTCRDINGTVPEFNSIVKVYHMPTYMTEIIIVLAINAALVLVFIACCVWTFFRDRKEIEQMLRRRKLGHRPVKKTEDNDSP